MNHILKLRNSKKMKLGGLSKQLSMIKVFLNTCLYCIGNILIGGMFLLLLWSFAMAFCHAFGLNANWMIPNWL